MKVIDPEGKLFRGRVGNMVYYVMNGKTYARRAAEPSKRERTERQRAVVARFTTMQQLYSYFHQCVSADIWRLAGQAKGKLAANLFHSVNCGCVDEKGMIVQPGLFRFSAGSLVLPTGVRVERAGDGEWRVTWDADDDWTTSAADDRLMVGLLYGRNMDSPRWASGVTGRRGDGAGSFRTEEGKFGAPVHAYVLFAREDGSAYSPSLHFPLADGAAGR